MPIKVGTEAVSDQQLRLLEDAKSEPSARVLFNNIYTVINDEDIESGQETLHPAWVQIYQENRKKLQIFLAPSRFERIDRIFKSFEPFDPGVSVINPETDMITFILGAGASKPAPSGIPTVKELLPDLLMRARRLDRDDVTRLADFCEEANIENIEDLLTAAQLAGFCSRNPIVLRLVDFLLYRQERVQEEYRVERRTTGVDLSSVAFLQDTLQVLFGLLSSRMLPAKPNKGHEAIANYVIKHPKSPIVTTNYDCCMDLALRKKNIDFSYMVEFSNSKPNSSMNEKLTRLIKLHGSLNWFYCETCQQVHLIDIERTVKDYLQDRAFYPVIGICKDCGGQRRGLLVPPLAMKFDIAPPLNSLLDRAQESFKDANVVVVVGFSFAQADLYISRMLSKWMQISKDARLVVFDPDYSVVEKVRRQFAVRIPSFDKSRILRVAGDCSDTLPKFLAGEYRPTKSKAKKRAKKSLSRKKPRRAR